VTQIEDELRQRTVPPASKANVPVTLKRSFAQAVGVLIGDTVPSTNLPVRARLEGDRAAGDRGGDPGWSGLWTTMAFQVPGSGPEAIAEPSGRGGRILDSLHVVGVARCRRCSAGRRSMAPTVPVPKTLSRHATCTCSCTRPPSRSRRNGRTVAPERRGV
jgi:hypothetical protein